MFEHEQKTYSQNVFVLILLIRGKLLSLLDGAKYHKKELVYLPCNDETWLVDELRERRRPTEGRNLQLSEVLRRSEIFEKGEGLLPVRTEDCLLHAK